MTTPESAFSAITDAKAWAVKDSTWVEARKMTWRKLAADGLGDVERAAGEVRALQDYFLTGKTRTPIRWASLELSAVPLLFRLWFHPDQSEANWTAQVAATRWVDYEISAREIRFLCNENGPGVGGLECRLYQVLFGGTPTRTFLSQDLDGNISYVTRSIEEYRWMVSVVALERALRLRRKNTRLLERCSMKHWLQEPADSRWLKLLERDGGLEIIRRLFYQVCVRSDRQASKGSSPGQIELAAELRELFDQGGGPERFQQEWQNYRDSDAWKVAPERK